MLGGEELHRDLGADPGPLGHGQRVVTRVTLGRGEVLHPLGDLEPEGTDVAGVHPVRGAEPGRRLVVLLGQPGALEAGLPLRGSGWCPDPNSSRICSAVTSSPTARPSIPASPDPTHRPGVSPLSV